MNPAEAGAVEIEEPDWRIRFEEHILRWPNLPHYLAEDSAFEATLRDWRRFHKLPAVDGIINLARLGIMPPRSTLNDISRDGMTGYQHDDHMWLSIAGEQWRIIGIEDRQLCLEKGFQTKRETKQIDLSKARWTQYIATAIEVLRAMSDYGLDNVSKNQL